MEEDNFDLLEYIGGCSDANPNGSPCLSDESGVNSGGSDINGSPYSDLDVDAVAEEVLRDLGVVTDDGAKGIQENDADKCPVCEGPVGRYVYFGARVCLSCRGFFRRSVQSDQHRYFVCVDSAKAEAAAKCSINSKSRKSCRRCRFDKCLQAGMVVSWVMSDVERKKRIAMTPHNKMSPTRYQPELLFTDAEKSFMESEFKAACDASFRGLTKRLSKRPELFKSCLDSTLRRSCLQPEVELFLESSDEIVLKNHLFEAEALKSLSSYDKMSLINANYDKMFGTVYLPLFYLKFEDILWSLEGTIKYIRRNPGSHLALEAVLEEFGQLDIRSQCKAYKDDFYLTARNSLYDASAARKQIALLNKMAPHLKYEEASEAESCCEPDAVITMLVVVIMMTSGDGVRLEDPEEVSRVREATMAALHRYLKTHYGRQASNRLHNILMAMAYWEQVINIHKAQASKFKHKLLQY